MKKLLIIFILAIFNIKSQEHTPLELWQHRDFLLKLNPYYNIEEKHSMIQQLIDDKNATSNWNLTHKGTKRFAQLFREVKFLESKIDCFNSILFNSTPDDECFEANNSDQTGIAPIILNSTPDNGPIEANTSELKKLKERLDQCLKEKAVFDEFLHRSECSICKFQIAKPELIKTVIRKREKPKRGLKRKFNPVRAVESKRLNSQSIKCAICKYETYSSTELEIHTIQFHYFFECDLCKERFFTHRGAISHYNKHRGIEKKLITKVILEN